jgi:hypothetical protein
LFIFLVSCGADERSGESALVDANDNEDKSEKVEDFTETESLYVLARNGLRMRKEASLSSEKMEVVPYGTQIQAVTTDSKAITVGAMKGNMVKVFHGKDQGYMFDGYLTSIPVPQKEQMVTEYTRYLKRKSIEADYEEDMVGEIESNEVFAIPAKSFHEALLIGQRIHYFISFDFDLPQAGAKKLDFVLNGKKHSARALKNSGDDADMKKDMGYDGDYFFVSEGFDDIVYWMVTIGLNQDDQGNFTKLMMTAAYEGGSWGLEMQKEGDKYVFRKNSRAD